MEGKNTAHVCHSFIINSAQVGQRARTLVKQLQPIKGDTPGKSDWCRETVFPELYFGGLVEALEEHMANGDLVFPDGK